MVEFFQEIHTEMTLPTFRHQVDDSTWGKASNLQFDNDSMSKKTPSIDNTYLSHGVFKQSIRLSFLSCIRADGKNI